MAIGKTTPTRTLDVSGNFRASGNSQFTTISEGLRQAPAPDGSNHYTINYSNGGTHYLSGHTTAQNITLTVNNFPNLTDVSNTYVMSALMKGASSENTFANSITLNEVGGSNSVTITPKFPSSTDDVRSQVVERSSSDFILQQFTYLYLDASGHILSNVSTFQ